MQIPNTRGNPQATEIAVQDALAFLGSLSREDLQTVMATINADLARLYEDRNILLTNGGTITYLGNTVLFSEALTLEINSQVAGGAPTVIDLGSATRTVDTDGDMIYAVVNRGAGTAVVTDDATTLPAVTSPDKEVFLIAKRVDSGGGVKHLYFMNGSVIEEGQSVKLGASSSGGGESNYAKTFVSQ